MPPQADSNRKSDNLSVETLNQDYRVALRGFFSRRDPGSGEIEDMVQEVFERLLRRGDISSLEGVRGYLFETANSVLLDRVRKRKTRLTDAHVEFDPNLHGDADFSPERVMLGRERLAQATSALLELPERTQVIFVLRRLEGLKYQEIAARLNISVSAVEKHVQRAIVHLMKQVDR
jgi:RNA polymerase sigma-70 factor (ECF subfamily)